MTYRAPDDKDAKREARADAQEVADFGKKVKRTWSWAGLKARGLGCVIAFLVAVAILVGLVCALVVLLVIALKVDEVRNGPLIPPSEPVPSCVGPDGGTNPYRTIYCAHHFCPPCE